MTDTIHQNDPFDPAQFTGSAGTEEGPSQDDIVRALKTVYDPEIPVDIYELGLIYDVKVEKPTCSYHYDPHCARLSRRRDDAAFD